MQLPGGRIFGCLGEGAGRFGRRTETAADEGEEERGVARDLGRNLELCSGLAKDYTLGVSGTNVPRSATAAEKMIMYTPVMALPSALASVHYQPRRRFGGMMSVCVPRPAT